MSKYLNDADYLLHMLSLESQPEGVTDEAGFTAWLMATPSDPIKHGEFANVPCESDIDWNNVSKWIDTWRGKYLYIMEDEYGFVYVIGKEAPIVY